MCSSVMKSVHLENASQPSLSSPERMDVMKVTISDPFLVGEKAGLV